MYLSVSITSYNLTILGCLSIYVVMGSQTLERPEKQNERITNSENLDLSFDLRHANCGFDVMSFDELDGNFLAPGGVKTEFDLSKLALAERMEE